MAIPRWLTFLTLPLFAATLAAGAASLTTDSLTTFNRQARITTPGVLHLDARPGEGVAWLDGVTFTEGRITLEVRSPDKPFESRVGIAFHGQDDRAFDAVYVTPRNLKAFDDQHRPRDLHYVSRPGESRERQHQGQVPSPPPSEAWVKLSIEIEGQELRVMAGDDDRIALRIELPGARRGERVGLWVGDQSEGWFRELKIEPRAH
jgi:hypothetical protein